MWMDVKTANMAIHAAVTGDDGEGSSGDKGKAKSGRRPSLRNFRLFVLNDMHKTTDSRLSVIGKFFWEHQQIFIQQSYSVMSNNG